MKMHIENNTVQETLIIPLFGRKVCSERFPQLLQDREAERICALIPAALVGWLVDLIR